MACKHPNVLLLYFVFEAGPRKIGRSRSKAPGPADPTGFFFQEAITGVYLLSYLELIFTKYDRWRFGSRSNGFLLFCGIYVI